MGLGDGVGEGVGDAGFGPDLEMRDPHNINDHVRVSISA